MNYNIDFNNLFLEYDMKKVVQAHKELMEYKIIKKIIKKVKKIIKKVKKITKTFVYDPLGIVKGFKESVMHIDGIKIVHCMILKSYRKNNSIKIFRENIKKALYSSKDVSPLVFESDSEEDGENDDTGYESVCIDMSVASGKTLNIQRLDKTFTGNRSSGLY